MVRQDCRGYAGQDDDDEGVGAEAHEDHFQGEEGARQRGIESRGDPGGGAGGRQVAHRELRQVQPPSDDVRRGRAQLRDRPLRSHRASSADRQSRRRRHRQGRERRHRAVPVAR